MTHPTPTLYRVIKPWVWVDHRFRGYRAWVSVPGTILKVTTATSSSCMVEHPDGTRLNTSRHSLNLYCEKVRE